MSDGFWKDAVDRIGVGGSLIAALCCLGFPAILSIVSAIGLGFIINDAILIPLLAIFLVITLIGLYLGIRHHGGWVAVILGIVSAIFTFGFIVFILNKALALIGVAGLVAASLLNVWLRMLRAKRTGR